MKRIFTLLIIATMFAISSLADDVQIDGIYYNLNDETKTAEVTSTSSYNTYSGDITIPEKITYNATEYSVTSIGNDAFYWSSSLTSITIPNSVTSIGIYAFYDCSSLTSITIPNSVISIGNNAFSSCSSLTSITIPNSVTSIGSSTFQYCSSLASITIGNSVTSIDSHAFQYCSSLTSITIPNSVTSIGRYAFSGCSSLTSITIPNSVTSIDDEAFFSCSSLTSIDVEANNQNYASINGVLYDKDVTTLIRCPNGKTSITIPNSVTSIGNYAFSNCSSLTSITIPNSVTSIGDWAFSSCSSLTSISIPNSVTSIGDYAFSSCSSLTSITIPNSVTSTGNSAFSNCSSLTSISIPNSVTSIGSHAFSSCTSLTSITIPNSVTSIGNYAFQLCTSLTSITIPNSVTSIGNYVFRDCSSLTSITIPNSVTSIGDYAFYNCSGLTSINIEATIPPTMGGANTFNNVSKNIPVTVPCGSLSAYQSANYWSEFTNYVEEFPYTFSATTADATMGSVTIETAPACGVDAVIKATHNAGYRFVKWSDGNTENPRTITVTEDITLTAEFANDIIASGTCGDNLTWQLTYDSVLTISGTGNMYDYTSTTQPWRSYKSRIKSVVIEDGATSIGNYAFQGCSGLTSVAIPNSVTTIGNYAFQGCSGLTSVTISNSVNSVTTIGNYAFSGCSKITEVHISNLAKWCDINFSTPTSNPLYSKKAYLYVNNSKITDLVIPEGVDSIKNNAFAGYALLNSVTIPNSVTTIGNYAFRDCSGLTSVTIPNSVTSIGNYAFQGCSGLTSITMEATTPPTIKSSTFTDVSKTITVTMPCGSLETYQSAEYWSEFSNYEEAIPYTLSVATSDETMGSVTIETAPTCGVDAVIKATPNDDYRFVKWSDGNTENPRTITVTEDITLTAIFEVIKFHVSVTCNNPAMGMVLFTSGTNDTDYEKGATVSFVAITNSGYLFNGWSDGVKDVFRTIVITQDTTITALFGSNTCSLTLNTDATMGSVTGSGTYTKGTTATIIATPNAGYQFVKWSDGNTNATRSIVVNEDMTLSAIFEKIPTFTISITTNAQMGSATGGGTFETGKTTTLSAIANEGYHFVKWSDGITTNPRTITVTQNISLEAIFEALYVNWYPDNNSDEHSFIGKHYYDTVTITAGKTLIIEDKATIACNDIVIKADKNGNVPDIKVVGDIIANNGVTYEWQIDDTRWYFFSLPFNCKIQDITLSTIANGPNDGVWNYYNPNDGSGDFIIRKYNQKNASNGQGKKTGWEDCKGNEMLHKGRGYIIGLFPSGSKAKAMFKSEKQELLSKLIDQELDFGDDHSWFDYQAGDNALYNGWNLIGVPYFEAFSQGELDVAYVSIPNSDGVTYKQYTLSEALSKGLLRPFMSFFIQLGENRAPIFSPNDRSNAPMLKTKENVVDDKIITSIRYIENEELSDKTTIINNVALTTEYEIGHDLQKMIGYAEQPQIYTIEECGILAFNAQDVSSRMSIRLGVYAPVDGEYVIGGEAWGDMADVMLYDNETYRSTSLIIPQTVYLEKGVHDERFEIRVQSSSVTTDVDNEMSDLEVMINDGRLYVENLPANAVLFIYDMNGKLVHQQQTDTAIDYEFYAQGIYNITICTDNNKVFNTKIAY